MFKCIKTQISLSKCNSKYAITVFTITTSKFNLFLFLVRTSNMYFGVKRSSQNELQMHLSILRIKCNTQNYF